MDKYQKPLDNTGLIVLDGDGLTETQMLINFHTSIIKSERFGRVHKVYKDRVIDKNGNEAILENGLIVDFFCCPGCGRGFTIKEVLEKKVGLCCEDELLIRIGD